MNALDTSIAAGLELPREGVGAVLKLLEGGATVPFIARYRKEATHGLDEVQIRAIEEERDRLVELEARREAILRSIAGQDKLTLELRAKVLAAATRSALEDLYLPFKPKRRTRATIAREKGLEPLALRILAQPNQGDPREEGQRFVDAERGVNDVDEALAFARDIAAEAVAERAPVRALVRQAIMEDGLVRAQVVPAHAREPSKYEQYYQFSEPVRTLPSHRYLALMRGESEGILRVGIELNDERVLPRIATLMQASRGSPFVQQLISSILDAYKRLILPSIETEVRGELKQRSDRTAVEIFADNLKNLLLAAPLGEKAVIGVDPGLRTGSKCVAVDPTGKFLGHLTIYPGQGEAQTERAKKDLAAFVRRFSPAAIAVGNGTAGRETEAFVRELLANEGIDGPMVVSVNESGASVYSASDVAREEFPDLDVTIRGAISIARRLQDPLAELVKIDPEAIGVGQYQHDVPPPLLKKKLDDVVESCVNKVGVELNTASAPLLSRVAGVGPRLAKKIVEHRERHGAFRGRNQLLDVSGLGPKAFEQAAGFLRIRGGAHPLDASSVHPERYHLVERMARDLGEPLTALLGDDTVAARIVPSKYAGDGVGEPTLMDILAELKKPGRDPRETFRPPRFLKDVMKIEDLKPGMVIEGVVTNVVAFGAFVDVGVHHDGLVHISQLADRFVREPSEVVKVGDRLVVRVLEVDLGKKRISLSAKGQKG